MEAPSMVMVAGTMVFDTPKPPTWLVRLISELERFNLSLASPERLLPNLLYLRAKQFTPTDVLPLCRGGLARYETSRQTVKRAFLQTVEATGGVPLKVRGQSQGALMACELALDPETMPYVREVYADGPPFGGTDVVLGRLLGWSKVFPGVAAMAPERPEMNCLLERLRTSWPTHIPLNVTVTPHDEFATPWGRALQVELSPGSTLRRFIACPIMPDISCFPFHITHVPTRYPLSHLAMEWHRGILGLAGEQSSTNFGLEPVSVAV